MPLILTRAGSSARLFHANQSKRNLDATWYFRRFHLPYIYRGCARQPAAPAALNKSHMNTPTDALKSLITTLAQVQKPQDQALVRCPPPGAHVPTVIHATPVAITTSPPETRLLRGRPRTGAVASLPKDRRDLVCRLIGRGVPYKKIAQAIEQLGFVITERNISNWVTHGGYAEWCTLYQDALQNSLRQDDLLQYHRSDNSADLAEVGLQAAAVRLSELLLHQAAHIQAADGNVSKLEPTVTLLCRVNKELLNGQKFRDDCKTKAFRAPARLKAKDHDKLAELEASYSASAPRKCLDNECPHPDHTSTANSSPQTSPASNASAPSPALQLNSPPAPETTTERTLQAQPQPAAESSLAQPSDPGPIKAEPEIAN
jgi:hypothetical protein